MPSQANMSSLEKGGPTSTPWVTNPMRLWVGRQLLLLPVCHYPCLVNKLLLIYIWCQNSPIIGKKKMLVFIILQTPHLGGSGGLDFNPLKRAQEDTGVGESRGWAFSLPQHRLWIPTLLGKGFETQCDRQSGWSPGEERQGAGRA